MASQSMPPSSVFDLVRRHAGGIRAADEAAHAGAGDEIDGDAMFFEPAEHADVGEAAGAAAAERDADLRAGCGRSGLRPHVTYA